MRVRLWVNKVAALRAGLDEHGPVDVDIPAGELTPEERDLLVRFNKKGGEGPGADFHLDGHRDIELARADKEVVRYVLGVLGAREERKKGGENKLREWASTNGSALLLARMNDGFTWAPLARQEFLDSILSPLRSAGFIVANQPPGGAGRELTVEPNTTPSLDQMDALRRARELVGDLASLAWVSYSSLHFKGGKICRAELLVTATAPDGVAVSRRFLINF
jgi:hypothetical protein